MRLSLDLSALSVAVEHEATCPDVAPQVCATEELPVHVHDLLTWQQRAELGVEVGLGKGFQMGLMLPVELRVVRVEYRLLDGSPYEPPYLDIHHRSETLVGPADGELVLSRFQAVHAWTLGARVGATLPLGRTEEDPYRLGEEGLEHQHHQLGAGVPLLTTGLSTLRRAEPWGLHGSFGARLAPFENAKGYRAPLTLHAVVGPTRTLGSSLLAQASVGLVHEGQESWSGQAYPGRDALMIGGGVEWTLSSHWALRADVRGPVWQRLGHAEHGDEDGELRLGPRLGLGVSWMR